MRCVFFRMHYFVLVFSYLFFHFKRVDLTIKRANMSKEHIHLRTKSPTFIISLHALKGIVEYSSTSVNDSHRL